MLSKAKVECASLPWDHEEPNAKVSNLWEDHCHALNAVSRQSMECVAQRRQVYGVQLTKWLNRFESNICFYCGTLTNRDEERL